MESPRALFMAVGIVEGFVTLARMYGARAPCFAGTIRGVLELGKVKGRRG